MHDFVLYSNKLTGSIPTSIGQMSSLSYLDVHVNSLNGISCIVLLVYVIY